MNDLKTLPARAKHARPFYGFPVVSAGTDAAWINKAYAQALSVSQQLASPGAIVQRSLGVPAQPISLEEQLYNSRAAFKIRTATIAMHLSTNWRTRLFNQVDSLLSLEDWERADAPISEASFATLLRMVLLVQAKRRPGLGATSDGHVIAMWTVGSDRLTIECLPADEIRWVVVCGIDGDRESAAGQTVLARLLDVLKPYAPERWFADEGPKDST